MASSSNVEDTQLAAVTAEEGNVQTDDIEKIATESSDGFVKAINTSFRSLMIYATFFLVGAGCGWFPGDAILNLLVNEKAFDDAWQGRYFMIAGIVGICSSVLYAIYVNFYPDRQPLHREQAFVTALILLNVVNLAVLAGCWNVGPPHYPIIIVATVVAILVVSSTYYFVFPMLATFYGGWIVAPARSGSDVSVLVTNLVGEAQNPSGSKILFPSSVAFLSYVPFCVFGLAAWFFIVRSRVSLRSESEIEELKEDARDVEASDAAIDKGFFHRIMKRLDGFACPAMLLSPVLLGTLADCIQWSLLASTVSIGASMTDPAGCSGLDGRWVARTSITVNRVFLIAGSVGSSLTTCPRWLFHVLSLVQVLAFLTISLAIFGIGRQAFWITSAGQWVYIVCNAVVGCLEGYIFTMAYRYVADDDTVPMKLRRSATSLLGFLNVMTPNLLSIVVGALVGQEVIMCQAL